MDKANVLPTRGARQRWAVSLQRPRLRVGPFDCRREAARVLRRLLARHPDWLGEVAPWADRRP
jgi:hypothetical protein